MTQWWGLLVVNELHTQPQFAVKSRAVTVLAHVPGTHEQAMDALYQHAVQYQPWHPENLRRRLVYRDGDEFVLICVGLTASYHYYFRVAELLWDSDPSAGPPPIHAWRAR